MAKFPKGLCFLLIVWLVLSRPSAAGRTGSPNPSRWWGTEQSVNYEDRAKQLRKTGNYPALEKLYQQADNDAAHAGDIGARISYLTALGNTYVYLFRYAEAVEAYRKATELAEQSGNWEAAGAVAPGLSSVYYLVGDWPSARVAIDDGLADIARLSTPPYYKAQLIFQHARLQADVGDTIADARQAVDAARTQEEGVSLEGASWDLVGMERIQNGQFAAAESALGRALWLRRLRFPRDLHFSYWHLGALRLAEAQALPSASLQRQQLLTQAEHFTALAIQEAKHSGYELATGVLVHQRGAILRAEGRIDEALDDFSSAARMADRWRLVVPSAGASLTAANIQLEGQIFQTFVEASAEEAIRTGNPRWLRTSFLAAELNRAASLRQSRQLAEVWRRKLPSEYWALLAHLRTEEASHVEDDQPTQTASRLHMELSKMEAAAGLGFAPIRDESFSDSSSLIDFQRGLGNSDLLLSFHTGTESSYLWAMTQDSLHLYKLPRAETISSAVGGFREAVIGHQKNTVVLGASLYQALFGQLSQPESAKTSWLLSLEGPLFELPFAALTLPGSGQQKKGKNKGYLVENHSLQVIPGARFLTSQKPRRTQAASLYLGVGDAVYNQADGRSKTSAWYQWPWRAEASGQLNRLVASHDEIERSASAWQQSSQQNNTSTAARKAIVLSGPSANREQFLNAVSSSSPSTIHLATHVLLQPGNGEVLSNQAFLAFSIGQDGRPELLATSEVALLRVPGSLVVMTGCASGTGDVVAGAGLLGLTRAWLVAGASAVMATGWAIEDSHGDLLPSFYRHSQTASVAEALRASQVEMLRSGTWQADPAYWAAYQVTGGAR